MLSIASDIVTIIGGLTIVGSLYQYLKAKSFEKEVSFLEIIDSFNSSIEVIEEKLELIEGWNDYILYEEGPEVFDKQLNQLRMQESRSQKNMLYLDLLKTLFTYSGSMPLQDIFESDPYIVGELVELLVQKSEALLSDYKTEQIVRFRKYCLQLSDDYLSIHKGGMEEEDVMRYKELHLDILNDVKSSLEKYVKEKAL
ncbi:hypothetical protein J5581_10055 [Streptococcus suis]|nr:hypothetical protein [Streptococcus suis]MBM0242389.1 hypothetical protein [Streptococcus suis]MBM7282676.1 hypothetical protein [Streptococcus suis]MBO4136193.1 hypothetical protein [Streptococcus suis]MDW8710143.1 hypothetical protein [Streptococcus suis]NJW41609.1 hypothetical protein [Streptococcus suis]